MLEAIERAQRGLIDADLGGPEELAELRKVGLNWLNATPHAIANAIGDGLLKEVESDPKKEI